MNTKKGEKGTIIFIYMKIFNIYTSMKQRTRIEVITLKYFVIIKFINNYQRLSEKSLR